MGPIARRRYGTNRPLAELLAALLLIALLVSLQSIGLPDAEWFAEHLILLLVVGAGSLCIALMINTRHREGPAEETMEAAWLALQISLSREIPHGWKPSRLRSSRQERP